jgi:hypothetical protein
MSTFEPLIEFEQSFSCNCDSHQLILSNLELKIEAFDNNDILGEEQCHRDMYSKHQLISLFENYSCKDDQFLTCKTCGCELTDPTSYKSCCSEFVLRVTQVNDLTATFWLSFVNNPTTTINTFPSCTKFFALQQGIPPPLRTIIWKKLFLFSSNAIPQLSKILFTNFQHSYNEDISKQISKDLSRTFPLVDFFKLDTTISNLSTILNVYANYDAELGYCQGLLFLVGVLYHNFDSDCQMTFHALISIMNLESEVHDIFESLTMPITLGKWHHQFKAILGKVDPELYNHLDGFVELNTFLYQWWLSFVCSHIPDMSVVNRNIDFCMIQGWKVGLFKISLGLLISNKPILMAVGTGDEEVIYQHLLNESKWGNVINNLDYFYGDLLLSWEDELFMPVAQVESTRSSRSSSVSKKLVSHTRTPSMLDKVKDYVSSSASSTTTTENHSSLSLSSTTAHHVKKGSESIYSDISLDSKLFTDYMKLPPLKLSLEDINNDLMLENQKLKLLLSKAYDTIQNAPNTDELQQEIRKILQT